MDKIFDQLEEIFAPKLILLKSDEEDINCILEKLAIKYKFVYIDAKELIKQNIIENTNIGKELSQIKKPKELKEIFKTPMEIQYGIMHYDFERVLTMVKEKIEQSLTNEPYLVINNLLNSHKLSNQEDKLKDRKSVV